MDIVERLAQQAAETINGGEFNDGKWYTEGQRQAWRKALTPAADEIERLREALQQIADKNPFHNQCPPMNDLQYYAQVIVEMVTIANAALKESE